jgi:multidrug resistance efflux pump
MSEPDNRKDDESLSSDESQEVAEVIEEQEHGKEVSLLVRIVVIVAVLAVGVLTMSTMILLKEEPAEAHKVERSLAVETITVAPEDVPVTVSGLGEVRALNVVSISAEIPGKVIEIHPKLELGEMVPAGELLFRIDPRDYEAARVQAAAEVAQLEKTVERLTRQSAIDQERLQTLERNERLMEGEFSRVRDLYEKDDVGTRSAVDQAEMAFNQASDAHDQLGQQVALYPVQIEEAQSGLKGARARLEQAEANLSRTEVRAAFDARIKMVNLEPGQYLNPGMEVLTLADDSVLEISVSLDSRDARDWLQFEEEPADDDAPGSSWFGKLKPVPCTIAWTEDPEAHRWEGVAHRIESFDPQTRTVSVAVRVNSGSARASTGGLPLVEHMFCQVGIPGKVMKQVYRLPRWAVSYEGKVNIARSGRLAIQEVDVVRHEGEETFVGSGLNPGDTVITTRLVNPLPNELLAIGPETATAS